MFTVRSSLFFLALLLVGRAAPAAEKLTLSAKDVVKMLLSESLYAKQAKLQTEIAVEEILFSTSRYDTKLKLDGGHRVDEFRRTSTFFGNRIDTSRWNLSLSKQLPTGTLSSLTFRNERQQTFGAPVVGGIPVFPSDPLYSPEIEIAIAQPLMQNAFGSEDRSAVKAARLAADAAELLTQRELQQQAFQALIHYWNLVLFDRQETAMEESVRAARTFLQTMRGKEQLGTAEEVDLLAARANLLQREADLLSLGAERHQQEENLRVALSLAPDTAIDVRDQAGSFRITLDPLDALIARSLEKRPDVLAARQELDREKVELKMAKLARWPKLDLEGTLAANEIDTSYVQAASGMNNPKWAIGMRFELPLENRAARAKAHQAEAKKVRALLVMKGLENQLENELTRLYQELPSRSAVVEKQSEAEALQRKKLHVEMKKYEQGRSSSDMIIRFQDELLQTTQKTTAALRDYVTMGLTLKLAEGSILE